MTRASDGVLASRQSSRLALGTRTRCHVRLQPLVSIKVVRNEPLRSNQQATNTLQHNLAVTWRLLKTMDGCPMCWQRAGKLRNCAKAAGGEQSSPTRQRCRRDLLACRNEILDLSKADLEQVQRSL